MTARGRCVVHLGHHVSPPPADDPLEPLELLALALPGRPYDRARLAALTLAEAWRRGRVDVVLALADALAAEEAA